MRICLIPTDVWGVGSYRCLLPGGELEKRGHEVFSYFDPDALKDWHPTRGNQPLRNAIPVLGERLAGLRDPRLLPATIPERFDADVYVFQRRLEWWIPWAVARLRAFGKTVVSELDDLYDDLPDSPGRAPLEKHKDIFDVARFNESLGLSSAVTVSTPALKDWYSRYSDNIHVLPNFLDWEMWERVPLQYEVERPKIRVGWMGWLDWRGNDLAVLREFMHDWLVANPQVEFVSIGEPHGRTMAAGTVHEYLNVPPAQRRSIPGRRFQELPEILATIDIGLVPLERNRFNECKSWLKGLEYSACGIVPVATPTGQYRELIRHGDNGFLAESADQWVATLDLLVNDHELRRQVGARARTKAETLTVQKESHRWEDLYVSLADGGRADDRTADARAGVAVG